MTVRIEIGDWQAAPAVAERPAFAIGDIHGRDDLFQPLTEAIDRIIAEDRLERALRITLGDYVDRGPLGMSALKRALTWADVCLPGNHEQFLVVFLHGEPRHAGNALFTACFNGAGQLADELGLLSDEERDEAAAPRPILFASKFASKRASDFRNAVIAYLGTDLVEKLLGLPIHHRIGNYLFVHAGIHPRFGLGMLDQSWTEEIPDNEDIHPLWIRGPFLTHDGPHDENVIVIHGHTTMRDPEILSNRINLDTKAYRSGVLTAVELRGNQLRIIQAIGEPG